jgi:hypothetical protein
LRSGQPLPERIANAPELRLGLVLYINAFFDLDTERSHGAMVGLKHIPWSSIKDYALAYELDEYQTESLFYFIKAMDCAHLKNLAEQIKGK